MAAQIRDALIRGYGKDFTDLSPGKPDYKMLENLEANVYQFSAAKNYQQLKDMTAAIMDGKKIRPYNEFVEEVKKINNIYNQNWLRTEYNTAVSSSQSAARWTDYVKTKRNLMYDAVNDSQTRSSHLALDGVIKSFDDPFWNSYYPPIDWNCRCGTRQVRNDKITPDNKINAPEMPDMFKVNLAKEGLVFPNGHPYYDMPKGDLKKVKEFAKKNTPSIKSK